MTTRVVGLGSRLQQVLADPWLAARGGYGRSRGRRDDRDDRNDAEPARERYEKRASGLSG